MKLFEKEEKTEKMLERLTKLESLPSTKQALESEKAEILAKRKAAAAAIEAIEGDTGDLIRLERDLEVMAGHLKVMDERREGLQKALNEKKVALLQAKQDREGTVNQNQEILLSTYPEEIDQAIEFFRDKLADLRKPGRITNVKTGAAMNLISWKKSTGSESNEPAILEAMRYCQAAVAELEAMRLKPELDEVKIKNLKKSLPRADVYTAATGERPMPKEVDPLQLIPSDEAMDWSLNRLHEKIQKVLRMPAKRA
jgi:hypothetical protein